MGASSEVPIPSSIRILILDYNFLGKGGCDLIGTVLSASRSLRFVSLERCRFTGKDTKKLFSSLMHNEHLRGLSVA